MSTPRLYKVLTPTGRAPFVVDYQWSLPKCMDGVWVPGAWHEESTDGATLCGKGLHITAFPLQWRRNPNDVVWHVEAEGLVGDPLGDKVIAARVRILRPLTAEELARLPDDARALNDERQAAEKRRRLSEMAKLGAEKAARQREEIAAARDAGVKSPARYAFEMLAAITDRSSWRAINSSRYAALKFLVEHVSFDPNDFGAILGDYNGGFWIGENGAESLYALAIASENTSAAVSIEKHLGRKPFWQRGFARRGKPTPKVRTAVGDWIRVDGRNLKVTSIRDDKGYLNAQEYREVKRGSYTDEERVGGVVKVTHAQLLAGSTKAQGAEAVS